MLEHPQTLRTLALRHKPTAYTRTIAALAAGALSLVALPAQAQSYFTPLVTPPASAGRCVPTQQVPVRGDTTHVVQHHLVMKSVAPRKSARDIIVVTGRGRSVVYSDMSNVMVTPASSRASDVVAVTDTLGHMQGWWMRSTTTFPDSLVRKRPDSATLQHLGALARHSSSPRTPLTAADEARVRAMTAWALKRCP